MNIPAFIDTVLWPIKWLIEAVLVGAHALLTQAGLGSGAGITWVLAVLALVLVVRAALIPLFVRQIRSQRAMMRVAPQLREIQAKYKGKRDQLSREAMTRETLDLYRREGVSPAASLVPLLVQLPVFFGLFSVLNGAEHAGSSGVGLLNSALSASFAQATLFGAPLRDSIATAHTAGSAAGIVIGIAIVMIVLMGATQLVTQLQVLSRNVPPETRASPSYRQQRIIAFVLPLVFIYSGIAFSLGVMFYWLFSNLWTMGQQFLVISNAPALGSDAAERRDARLARRTRLKRSGDDATPA